jgi:putative acetyltransferase
MSGSPPPDDSQLVVRRAQPAEHSVLLAIWERSVRATHTFLTEADIAFYRPLTGDILAGDTLELWVLTNEADVPIGFLSLAGDVIEALFLEPAHRRQGGGRRLIAHAQALRSGGALTVDVNEQNVAARAFYEALGFEVVGRSSLDPAGRPHPLLHLRRGAAHLDARSPQQVTAVAGASADVTTPAYTITQARPSDLSRLATIELAAARLLAGHAPESVLTETTGDEVWKAAHAHGHLWVALAEDVPVGFAHVEVLEPAVAHLEEIDVHPEHGRRGLGRKLVMAVCAWAGAKGYQAVTLTTFRDVPFNMPFYARLGFELIPPEEISSVLRAVVEDETRRGLDPARRVAMRRSCAVLREPDAAGHECGFD